MTPSATCIVRVRGACPGHQARASLGGKKYLSRFFADNLYGPRKAKRLAREATVDLAREAEASRRGVWR